MQYNADILLNIKNQASLDRVATTVTRINALVKELKPINLFSPGAGAGADQIRVAMKKIADSAKSIATQDGGKQLSATFAGAAQQARVFEEVMKNVKIQADAGTVTLEKQDQRLQNIARSFALATQKANELSARYEELRRLALAEVGIDVIQGPVSALDSPEAALAKQEYYARKEVEKKASIEAKITKEKTEQQRILERELDFNRRLNDLRRKRADEEARAAAEGLENIFLGAGFPLLFGGGAGAVGGGLLGSLFGDGFGGQIFTSAIGQQIDALAQSSIAFAQAFRQGGDAAGALTQALGYLDPEVRSLISNLQSSGQTARAAALAQSELSKVVGPEGAKALRDTGEELDQYQRSVKQLGLQFLAAAQSASRFFESLRGDFGKIPGLAPEITEEDVSQAARDREQVLKRSNDLLKAEVDLSGISQQLEFDKYTAQLKRVATLELINEKERIKLALDRGEITLAERKTLLEAARLNNQKELNRISKLEQENAARTLEQANQERDQSVKTGKQILNQLELELSKLGGLNKLQIDIKTVRTETQQTQERINELRDQEQRTLSTIMNNEREVLLIKQAQIEASIRSMALREADIKNMQDLLDERQLLIDRVKYGEKEAGIRQQIKNLTEGLDKDEAAYVEQLIRGNAAITERANELQRQKQLFTDIASSVKDVFSGAIDAAADNTKNFSEALQELTSDLLAAIGKLLIFYALAEAFGALGGTDGKGVFSYLGLAFGGNASNLGFAEGGYVTGPTRATVGEGGSSEYIVPSSKMDGAMQRWNQGMRGDSVVSGAEPTGGAGGVALAEAPTNIVVEGGVLNFNDSQYIRQDQVPSIVKQASAAGEAQALRKLQMSTATRKRIGL